MKIRASKKLSGKWQPKFLVEADLKTLTAVGLSASVTKKTLSEDDRGRIESERARVPKHSRDMLAWLAMELFDGADIRLEVIDG